ncbi:PqiB family protein [sulfur-oxidizing endosymbiont of Gigantopelta aegis]|uniref:PqiB family protein n=1 Tax=sulfur-oxidizing endosymbiont of Gigantopelta aegis TaxID=2794934 RepID=UPI0018DE42DF|nr:MlaD family protein [sulfur-oxidizing endosymbiont of Gigantopelta aegis]
MNKNQNTTPDSGQFSKPKISAKKSYSPIWILPIVALLIGLALIGKSYFNAGIMITLQVPTAEGIEVGKTKVLYKGIVTGVVKNRTVTEDLQNVILHIEMDKRTERVLNVNAKFWVVEPRISLSGVSGLDTILSGRYIAIDTGDKGKSKQDFIALTIPPPPSSDTPGLHIKLRLNSLQSIDRGTQIYYRQIPVGEVTNYTLEEGNSEIHAWVLIKPEYARLVKENSRFYNVSGVKIDAGLSGVKIEMESIVSLLAGGIGFYNPQETEQVSQAKKGAFFLLYSDFETAKVGIPIVLRLKNVDTLQENVTEIKFQGHKIGRIGEFAYDKQSNETIVLAYIDPLMENALKEETQFWLVKPSVSLLKISGLDALLNGNYIQMRPALKGQAKREFKVLESKPLSSNSVPGLHLDIDANLLGSITQNSPIYFKNIQIGHIEGYKLSDDSKTVQLRAFIEPDYAKLVKKHSRFYDVSGFNVSGGLSGIKVEVESLVSLLKGGIALYTPELEKTPENSRNGDRFKLYKNFEEAKVGFEIHLIFDSANGLVAGSTKVIYKGIVLGVVQKITPNKGRQTVTARVVLDPIAEDSMLEDTQFWMVKPKVSLGEIANLETLINGDYITLRIGVSKKKKNNFIVSQRRPPFNDNYPGLHLKLTSTQLGSVSVGAPVMFNRIKIGDVQYYELAQDRQNINILVHIWPQYMDIVRQDSRFYNASGVQLDANLAGIKIHTASIESILRGGIAIYNPHQIAFHHQKTHKTAKHKSKAKKTQKKHNAIANGTFFNLFNDLNAARLNAFYVQVQFKKSKGLVIGSKVQYRGISVGVVENIRLNQQDSESVIVTLELDDLLKSKLGNDSQFWIRTAKLGLARTENLDTLVKGSFISINPIKHSSEKPLNKFTTSNLPVFIGLEEQPLIHQTENGFNISLTASRLSSIKTGDPVYYRQVKVGAVVGYELADTADQILIHLRIRNRFKPLIRENSKFWHASGVAFDISLFGTSKIRTESLEAILAGGIAFATPDNDKMGQMLASGSFFVLHDEPDPKWTQWNPIIHLAKEVQQD